MINCELEVLRLLAKLYPNDVRQGVAVPLAHESRSIVETLIALLYARVKEEEDKDTCATACDTVGEALELFGLGCIQKSGVVTLQKLIVVLLQEQAPCQTAEAELEDDESIVADHDAVLIDSVTDLIAYLAQATGVAFDKPFTKMFPLLMAFYQPQRQSADRSMAIGCVAEVAAELGTALTAYLPKLLPSVLLGLNDNAIIVRRNAAFCYGVLAASGLPLVLQTFTQVLPLLQQITHSKINRVSHAGDAEEIEDKSVAAAEVSGCKDNIISAIGKMIVTCISSSDTAVQQLLPLESLLPFFLNELPLTGDLAESKNVYGCVMRLYGNAATTAAIALHTPQVMSIWSQVLGDSEVDASLQREMTAFIKQISVTIGQQRTEQIITQHVPQQHQQRFAKFLTS